MQGDKPRASAPYEMCELERLMQDKSDAPQALAYKMKIIMTTSPISRAIDEKRISNFAVNQAVPAEKHKKLYFY